MSTDCVTDGYADGRRAQYVMSRHCCILLHGQAVPVMLTACCLRAARFFSSSATRVSSNAAMAACHVVRHYARSSAAVLSDLGCRGPLRVNLHGVLVTPEWTTLWAFA